MSNDQPVNQNRTSSNNDGSDAEHARVSIQVEGRDYTLDLGQIVESISTERVLWWMQLLGRAEHGRIMAEAAYRSWRATHTIALALQHPKRAEWKVRAEVEADVKYIQLHLAMAEAERAAVTLRELVAILAHL